jgi:hypothetical protein
MAKKKKKTKVQRIKAAAAALVRAMGTPKKTRKKTRKK